MTRRTCCCVLAHSKCADVSSCITPVTQAWREVTLLQRALLFCNQPRSQELSSVCDCWAATLKWTTACTSVSLSSSSSWLNVPAATSFPSRNVNTAEEATGREVLCQFGPDVTTQSRRIKSLNHCCFCFARLEIKKNGWARWESGLSDVKQRANCHACYEEPRHTIQKGFTIVHNWIFFYFHFLSFRLQEAARGVWFRLSIQQVFSSWATITALLWNPQRRLKQREKK